MWSYIPQTMQENIKAASHVLKFIHYLRFAKDIAISYSLDYPDNVFTPLFKLSTVKIDWAYNQFLTHHLITTKVPNVVDMIKEKWESDQTAELAVTEKISLLNEEQLNTLDELLELILSGKNFTTQIID